MKAYNTPENTRIYAIGDIHGKVDYLTQLHEIIKEDASGFGGRILLIYLGDYVDRGPSSKEVLEVLISESIVAGSERIFLKGNHEASLIDFLDNPKWKHAESWISRWGGAATLQSYGLPLSAGNRDLKTLHKALKEKIPSEHVKFLSNLKVFHVEEGYLFVHAGLKRGMPLEKQKEDHMLWIKEEFLNAPHELPYKVVFGHSVFEVPQNMADRIAVDTGAYMGKALTAAVLEGEGVRFLQATG